MLFRVGALATMSAFAAMLAVPRASNLAGCWSTGLLQLQVAVQICVE
jgi:hypothetical protein